MPSILTHLIDLTGISGIALGRELSDRAKHPAKLNYNRVSDWTHNRRPIPGWVTQACAKWIVDIWLTERNTCPDDAIAGIDSRYGSMLDPTYGALLALDASRRDIPELRPIVMSMRDRLVQELEEPRIP